MVWVSPLRYPPNSLQALGINLWISFLMAIVASGIFFSIVDPIALGSCASVSLPELSRTAAYSVGFLLFWLFSFISGWLTHQFLIVSDHPSPKL